MQVSGVGDTEEVLVRADLRPTSSDPIHVRFNGDSNGNGNYHTWDESGTITPGQDGIVVVDANAFGIYTAWLHVSPNDQQSETSVSVSFGDATGDANGFAQSGGWTGGNNINSVEIINTAQTGNDWAGGTEMTVYQL
jgi:hypothetical protein